MIKIDFYLRATHNKMVIPFLCFIIPTFTQSLTKDLMLGLFSGGLLISLLSLMGFYLNNKAIEGINRRFKKIFLPLFLCSIFFASQASSEEKLRIKAYVYPGAFKSTFDPFVFLSPQSKFYRLVCSGTNEKFFYYIKSSKSSRKIGEYYTLYLNKKDIIFTSDKNIFSSLHDPTLRPTEILISEVRDKNNNLIFKLGNLGNYTKGIFNPNFDKEDFQNSPLGPGWRARAFYSSKTLNFILENTEELKVERVKIADKYAAKITANNSSAVYGIISNIFEIQPNTIYQMSWKSKPEFDLIPQRQPMESLTLSFMTDKGGEDIEHFTHKGWNYNIFPQKMNEWTDHVEIFKTPPAVKWAFLETKVSLNRQNGSFLWTEFEIKKLDHYPKSYSLKNRKDFFPSYTSYKETGISHKNLIWDEEIKGLTLSQKKNLFPNKLDKAQDWIITNDLSSLILFSTNEENDNIIKLGTTDAVTKEKITLKLKEYIPINNMFSYTLRFFYQAHKISSNQSDFFKVKLVNKNGEALLEDKIYYKFLKEPNNRLTNKEEEGWMMYEHIIPLHHRYFSLSNEVSFEIEKQSKAVGLQVKNFSLIQNTSSPVKLKDEPYEEKGIFTSKVFPINAHAIPYLEWKSTEPSNTKVEILYRSGVTSKYTPVTWTDWKKAVNHEELLPIAKGLNQLIQLKIVLTTEDSLVTPTLKFLYIYEKERDKIAHSSDIQLISLENGKVSEESVEYITLLEKEFYKKSLPEMVEMSLQVTKNYNNEMDKLLRLMDFTSHHTDHGFSLIGKNLDALSEFMSLAKGEGGVCGNIASMFSNLCKSSGFLARLVYLHGLSGSGHRAVEVWLDTYQKWVFIDPTYRGLFLHKGIPLSTVELHRYYQEDKIKDVEIYTLPNWLTPLYSMESVYGDLSQKISFKEFSSLFEIIYIEKFGCFKEKNYLFLNEITNRKFFKEEEAYFPINQVEMSFEVLDKDTIRVYLKNNAFHFHHYEAYVNGESNTFNKNSIEVKLKEGKNAVTIATVSEEEKKGKNFSVEFFLTGK